MKKTGTLFAVILCGMLSGCTGVEPNDEAYVTALGFDEAPNGNYTVTIQFARPTQISGGAEQGGEGNGIVENLVVEAPNISSAISLGNHTVSKELVLSHASLAVISAKIAQEGVADIIESLAKDESVRPDIYLTVSRGSARDYLYSVRPVVEVNPAKYYRLIFEQNDSIGVPKMTLEDFCRNRADNTANVVPVSGVISAQSEALVDPDTGLGGMEILKIKTGMKQDKGDDENSSSEGKDPAEYENEDQKNAPLISSNFEFGLRNYIAGQLAVNESNKSETAGMAVFEGDRAKAVGSLAVCEVYKLMRGDFKHAYVTVRAAGGRTVTMDITKKKKPRMRIDTEKKTVNIRLFLNADLHSPPAGFTGSTDIDRLEAYAGGEIKKACDKFIKELVVGKGADVLGIAEHSKSIFLTNGDYYKNRDGILKYPVTVSCDFHIRRTGLTLK